MTEIKTSRVMLQCHTCPVLFPHSFYCCQQQPIFFYNYHKPLTEGHRKSCCVCTISWHPQITMMYSVEKLDETACYAHISLLSQGMACRSTSSLYTLNVMLKGVIGACNFRFLHCFLTQMGIDLSF